MDRITTLMNRFHRHVHVATLDGADLVILGDANNQPTHILFYPRSKGAHRPTGAELWYASVDWAGDNNPIRTALPEVVDFDLTQDVQTQALVSVILQESGQSRCGAQWVLNRLGDVLLVRLLRDQLQRGSTEPGLIAGLADERLSRAIVAMHDHPGKIWTNADLATEAGLSLSRFNELFARQVGETPMSYLRRWRLALAQQDLAQGHRVDSVARRYGYSSPEAFSRAFKKSYGTTPITMRVTSLAAE
ncbi:MAG: helix-turn-helix domain-containing protein [Cognatishimia sp.]